MGATYSTLTNLSNNSSNNKEYQNYPPGCVICPDGYKPGNPGTFEEIHKKFDNLEPKHFEGLRLILKKNLSKHFNVSHAVAMCPKSSWMPDMMKDEDREQGYKFGASYTGLKRVGPRELYPQVYGDLRTNGDLTANFVHTLGCRCRLKLVASVRGSGVYESIKSTIEYRSDDCTMSATLVNPALLKQRGVLVLQYLQALSSRLTVGAELAHNRSADSAGESNWAGAVRYNTGFRTFSTTVGQAGLRICYHHRQSQHLQMGVEYKMNFITNESCSRLVYQVCAPMADLVVKGFVDTNWRVGAVLEKKLCPIPEASLVLSGILDHARHNVSVGVGINIG